MIWIYISLALLGLAMLYFIGQSIYYYNKIHKLEKRIEELENNIYSKIYKEVFDAIYKEELEKEAKTDKPIKICKMTIK